MSREKRTPCLLGLLVGALMVLVMLAAVCAVWFQVLDPESLRHLLEENLTETDPLPERELDALYVMGGSQESLSSRFRKAAQVYHSIPCQRIWTLSRPGITAYSSELDRNLTNDEWCLKKLSELGIGKDEVELLGLEEGFFGTYSEAKGLTAVLLDKGIKRLAILTSSYHTRRTGMCFKHFLIGSGVGFFVLGADEPVSLFGLMWEFLKLQIYNWLLV
jgi:uncharacterized SAM-binding protein YcdF (DUF218 family)